MKIMALAFVNLVIFIALFSPIWCLEDDLRDPKFSIFQIIKFENAPCIGGTRNGTCFTSAECESAGGKKDGDCADGFGVCCVTILSSGGSTSLNQSYIVEAALATPSTNLYTICPCSDDVCRIRYDFTAFELNAPVTHTTVGTGGAAVAGIYQANFGQSTGDCLTDQFSITGSSGTGSPILCGTGTGQHVFVDSNGSGCSTVTIAVGSTTATRNIDIMVTQFKCGAEMGGPPGCLQWFTTAAGKVRGFNFPNVASGTAVAATQTHLSSQKYTSCIRRPAGTTIICYVACTSVIAVNAGANLATTAQSSFGLSLANNAVEKSELGSWCTDDYLTIPGGDIIANLLTTNAGQTQANTRFCGRGLATSQAAANVPLASICTNSVPFTIGVHFDSDEHTSVVAAANTHEADDIPGGIVGFCLDYATQ
jgi:hypothetical protein